MSAPRTHYNIALIGFMGTGKSSVGQIVAAHLKYEFLDTDEVIESRARQSINQIFATKGEEAFRAMERQLVQELASRRHMVIATGGGLAADDTNLASLKQHALVVCLWASPEVIYRRVQSQTHRPLVQVENPLEQIRQLLAAREPYYKQADIMINAGLRSIREVAHQVLIQYQQARHASHRQP